LVLVVLLDSLLVKGLLEPELLVVFCLLGNRRKI